jgi:hypothetical protein
MKKEYREEFSLDRVALRLKHGDPKLVGSYLDDVAWFAAKVYSLKFHMNIEAESKASA